MNKIIMLIICLLYKVSEETLTAFIDVEAIDRSCFCKTSDF